MTFEYFNTKFHRDRWKQKQPFTIWYCVDIFYPWKDIVGKKVSKLRSNAELRAFFGTSFSLSTEYTELQRLLSGVYSIVMEKFARAGEGGGGGSNAYPFSLYLPSRTKLWCTLQLRGQINSPYLYSTLICTLYSVSLSRLKHKACSLPQTTILCTTLN